MFLPHFGVFCDLLLNRRMATWNLQIQTTTDKAFVYFKILQQNAKAGLCPLWQTQKKEFDGIYYLYKINQLHWLLCAAKNCGWLVQENHAAVKPDSSVAPRGMKTDSESRIELRNLKILKKMLQKSSQFLSSEQPCEPKSLDVASKIAGVEKIPMKSLPLVTFNQKAIWFEF